jgi:hypothetical protein
MNSFEIAMDKLEANQIDAEGARAMRVCENADAMLAILQAMIRAYAPIGILPQFAIDAEKIIAAIDPD